ncbi:FAD-dependent oxidoreductase [Bacillus sp. FSL K6-3431]|uniref:FAD-dependent oxidoreductase n=1 Tax=Bacillus sp. FSL K6-3431 TaxID=2921500 RepID=UPI0030F67AA7
MIDLLIAGGGLGGCAAALAACSKGLTVVMTEETDWIGGQVTTQAVPADENPWIEQFGCTGRYREYRKNIRDYYRNHIPLKESVKQMEQLNPGKALVSNIAHDPRISVHVLTEMLSPYLLTGQLTIHFDTIVKDVQRAGRKISSVTLQHLLNRQQRKISVKYIIDATEAGDLLPLSGLDYVIGSESKAETGEAHATEVAESNNIQAFTYVLAMEYRQGENHLIPEPDMYSFWKEFHPDIWPDKYLSFFAPHPHTLKKREYSLFEEEGKFSLWNYRRIYAQELYDISTSGDVTLLNWPQNDYFLGNIYDVSEEEKKKHLDQAKQLSLSLFYWLQTEAPRPNGKKGYPGLKLRGDVLGTEDGLAKSAYIRESRRIKALYTIKEEDVSPKSNIGKTGTKYVDRVGIGSYSMDMHPSMSGENYIDIPALPFHIPLGALIPQELDNMLAGNKNIGTTHITNGCYRLHPVEWNIGEACGELVAFAIKNNKLPSEIRESEENLHDFQDLLRANGFELEWPEEFYQ